MRKKGNIKKANLNVGVALALFTHSSHVNQQVIGVGVKSNFTVALRVLYTKRVIE